MIDVGYIETSGKRFPFRISYKVVKALRAETGKEVGDLYEREGDKGMDYDLFESLLYHGLKVGAWYDKAEFTISREDIENIMDADFQNIMQQVLELTPQFFNTREEEDSKKKKKSP